MRGTDTRIVAEYRAAIDELRRQNGAAYPRRDGDESAIVDNIVSEIRNGGVRLVEIENAGHHIQNDAVETRRRCTLEIRKTGLKLDIQAELFHQHKPASNFCKMSTISTSAGRSRPPNRERISVEILDLNLPGTAPGLHAGD